MDSKSFGEWMVNIYNGENRSEIKFISEDVTISIKSDGEFSVGTSELEKKTIEMDLSDIKEQD